MIDTEDERNCKLNQVQNEGIMQQCTSLSDLQKRADHWMNNGGREQLAEALAKAKRSADAIREAMRPDPESLRKPTTI